ncbi:hypothetical protein CEXT_371561 [Caerostris extrusa]|uniref:Uncharacterized protein n=1 Tax=Caerostris extrusa TaxID=172846 RepID=A0AAV4SY94_CAEEX|nr:hypothetical protein CEXT_371561 [Caerostris extrusa]
MLGFILIKENHENQPSRGLITASMLCELRKDSHGAVANKIEDHPEAVFKLHCESSMHTIAAMLSRAFMGCCVSELHGCCSTSRIVFHSSCNVTPPSQSGAGLLDTPWI